MKYIERLLPPTAVPALLLAFGTFAFRDIVSPSVGFWIGRIALVLLFASGLVYVTLLAFHRVVPRRFANLVYLFDDDLNVALIEHPFHKRLQPPGSRLGYHECPHEAVGRVLEDELGLSADVISFVPDDRQAIGNVTFVPPPIRVQIERHKQRLGVTEHYDFVYLCLIPGVRPQLHSSLSPQWMSLEELRVAASQTARPPFPDVIPSVEHLKSIAMANQRNGAESTVR